MIKKSTEEREAPFQFTKNVEGYTLHNEDKLNRAIYGTQNQKMEIRGGVGEDATDGEILAEYDRLGGLITKGKYHVKMGSFYDFKKRAPRAIPEVIFTFRVDGEIVEIAEGEEIPLDVQASEMATERKAAKAVGKAVKGKGKKKASIEDEE